MTSMSSSVDSSINFCDDEFNLPSAAISALLAVKLAVDSLCCKEVNLLTAEFSIKLMMGTFGNLNSIIATETLTAIIFLFHRGVQIYHRLLSNCNTGHKIIANNFPNSIKVNVEKIMLPLVKILSPPANDELNSTLVQHGVGHQLPANSFQIRHFLTYMRYSH